MSAPEIDSTKRGHVPCPMCDGLGEMYTHSRLIPEGVDGPFPCECDDGEVEGACPRCGTTGVSILYSADEVEAEIHGCERCCQPEDPSTYLDPAIAQRTADLLTRETGVPHRLRVAGSLFYVAPVAPVPMGGRTSRPDETTAPGLKGAA